jgi:beta-hydroxylase
MRPDPYAGPELSPPTTLIGRLAQGFIDWLQRRLLAASAVGPGPFFERARFPWVAELENAFPAVREELDALLPERARLPNFQDITPEVATITTDDAWKTFMFLGYGVRSEANLARCPATARALGAVPGLMTAFFSILEPGKRIPPHRGPYNGVLRLHLGLRVPEPAERCWIRVGGETRCWREGEAMIFDDAYPHEVHNDTPGVRAVLFLDFERPCRAPWRWLNRLVLRLAVFTPLIREARGRQAHWERLYYGR